MFLFERASRKLGYGSAGDSLLFAAGAFAGLGSLNVWALFAVFITAAILGDALNYAIGNYAGADLISAPLTMCLMSSAVPAIYTIRAASQRQHQGAKCSI